MRSNEILKQIRSCDMDEPFVFISYSSQDNQRVWEDVLRFQQMGYNVWLDEKNLDKTKASWREDALEAIKDYNCELLVFYVSRHSLVSQGCFSELECTMDYDTVATHNGPLKFIAVDAEPIDDIILFKQQIHTEIKRSKEISKNETIQRMRTMQMCVDKFFDSNNEKIRVKAYGLPNRKMDYYEEITASFPDESRIYQPKVEKAEPKTVVKEKPVAADPVHGEIRSNNSPRPDNFTNQSRQAPSPARSAPTPPPAPTDADRLFEEKLKAFMRESNEKLVSMYTAPTHPTRTKDADQLFEEKLKSFMRESDSRRSSRRAAQRINSCENPRELGTASARPTAPAMKTVKKTFSLEKAFADANQKLGKDATNQFTAFKDVSEKRMRNFKKAVGVSDSVELTGIEGLWGFGDGHEAEGLLVDEHKLYYGTNLRNKMEYRKVTSVEPFGVDGGLLLVKYEDSIAGSMILPDDFCAPIKAFLEACIAQRS